MMTAQSRNTEAARRRQPERRPEGWLDRQPRRTKEAEDRPTDDSAGVAGLPILLSADEAADLLRTSRRGIYVMVARDQLPGVTRIGRRMLIRSRDVLRWLDSKCAPSPRE